MQYMMHLALPTERNILRYRKLVSCRNNRRGNMSDYVISCCSTADLTKEHFEKRNIYYICFHYELNGKEYADEIFKATDNGNITVSG